MTAGRLTAGRAALAVALTAVLAGGACSEGSEPLASEATSTTRRTAAPAGSIERLLDELPVEPEHREGYDRRRFEHWIDADGDGCRTRCEVLEAERRTDLPLLESGWFSIYDGFTTDDPAKLEVDHVVALAEAWRSGAWAWDHARRRAFANDLDEPGALVAVSSKSGQAKADHDAAGWRPPRREAWCEWATSTIRVKAKWGLSVDERELAALRELLTSC